MDSIISYCGLQCSTCPIYLAARETDNVKKSQMKSEIIHMCKSEYGVEYNLEDINDCDGCRAETGRIFFACARCKIRQCASDKNLENCALCDKYICDKLRVIFSSEPNAKIRLDEIRSRA